MFALKMSEALSSLSTLNETLEILEWIDGLLFRKPKDVSDPRDDFHCCDRTENEEAKQRTNDCLPSHEDTSQSRSSSALNDSPPLTKEAAQLAESKNAEEDDHTSKDRLVEFLENKIERLHLGEAPSHTKQLLASDTDDANDLRCDSPNVGFAARRDSPSTTSSENNAFLCSGEIKENAVQKDDFEEKPTQDLSTPIAQNNALPKNDAINREDSDHSFAENLCVSSLECTFSISELSVNTIGTEQNAEDEEEEPRRTKRKLTVSWDPVPLLDHLYDLKLESFSERQMEYKPYEVCYLNVEPFGAFDGKGGSYYTLIEDNCLHFYESDSKEKCELRVPLQYAVVEVSDTNVLKLDNKLGKCFWITFGDEGEILNRKASIESHCKSITPTKYLEIVHYPLKFHKDVVIIDLGSCSTRAGILMDQPTLPKMFFPTVCATDKKTGVKKYGTSALMPEVRKTSTLSFPVRQSAKVTKFTMDIDALAGLFRHIFHELGVDPKNYTVQVCIPRSLSTSTQIALMKLLLEDFCVPAVSLTRQALLTLYANNISTAVVVDIGDRMEILPVVDGFILEGGVSRLPYGGQSIIHHMKHALAQKHISLSNDVESFLVKYIFENICYIAENYKEELAIAMGNSKIVRKSIPLHSFLRDDTKLQTVYLDIGRFQVPEGLFEPDLWGLDSPGLHKLVHQAIQISGMDARRQMAESIYVSGGVTLLPGFVERLESEVAKLTLPRLKPKVHASPYRYHMTYIGACQLASSEQFHQVCVSANEWNKKGQATLNRWHL